MGAEDVGDNFRQIATQATEPLYDPKQSRSSTSRQLHLDEPANSEEGVALLKDEDALDEIAADIEDNHGTQRDFSNWLHPLGLVFSILFLLTVATTSYMKIHASFRYFSDPSSTHGNTAESEKQEEMLGIRLHPEDHVSRGPQVITHDWNITSGFRSPDGVKKEVYLVNGLFPGPTIECRSGDWLVIHVTNSLSSQEGISIHWHGLEMRNATEMDGAVGFTQCPIPIGNTFTYEFRVGEDQAGTFWWHAHSQVHRGDGMYGGLVVHKPRNVKDEMVQYGYDNDILLLIGDWYHRSAEEILDWYTSVRGFGNEPVPDSLLINGLGRFVCSMAVPARPVECIDAKKNQLMGIVRRRGTAAPLRLRIANSGSLAGFTLQATSATLTPLTVDGGFPILGNPTNSVGILYPGERIDLLLTINDSTQSPAPSLNIILDPENFKYPNSALRPNQTFPIFSSTLDTVDEPEQFLASNSHFDISSATPLSPSSPMPQNAQQTVLLYTKTQKLSIDNNSPTGFMNRTTWTPQPLPLLFLPRSQWDKNQLVPFIPLSSPSPPIWVDVILNNLDDGSHPFHLHGYSFYVMASYRSEHGWGSYSPYADAGAAAFQPVMLENPLKRDTVMVPRRGYVIVRLKADNEGIWMLHCHVLFHQASGMAMAIHVGKEEAHEDVDLKAVEMCRNN